MTDENRTKATAFESGTVRVESLTEASRLLWDRLLRPVRAFEAAIEDRRYAKKLKGKDYQ